MHDVRILIEHHGNLFYLITFLWTALEGETFVIFAGLAAQRGLINVWLLFVAAWLGTLFGDQMFFLLGRTVGPKLLDHLPRLKPGVNKAVGWLERYAVIFIFSYRFMYGIRNVSGVAIGLSNIPWKRFAVLNVIAAFVWAVAFVGSGYIFGNVIGHMHHKQQVVEDSVRQGMLAMLGLFCLIIAVKLSMKYWRKRRLRRLAQTAAPQAAHKDHPRQ
jgi:membrane protein DedA with SNARE-associated domain